MSSDLDLFLTLDIAAWKSSIVISEAFLRTANIPASRQIAWICTCGIFGNIHKIFQVDSSDIHIICVYPEYLKSCVAVRGRNFENPVESSRPEQCRIKH